ncbi:MAG: replication-relaxation family protein [Deltaproteobacteria bacterium]|nr:replication-relaxation family protein [Deltaproteobacteria bacterium]
MKRARPNPDSRSIVGSSRDLEVLESIAWAGFLSTRQVQALHFPSRRTTQRRLRALLDHHLVRATMQGEALQRDNVYTITPAGVELLQETRGLDNAKPHRVPRLQKLRHGLAIRDVFVAILLGERAGTLRIADVRFEEDLTRVPEFVALRIVPDALLELGGQDLPAVAVEVDLGTETIATVQSKIVSYARLLAAGVHMGSGRRVCLLVVARTEARRLVWSRLLAEARLDGGSAVVRIDDPNEIVDRACSLAVFARPVLTERMGPAREAGEFRPVFQPDIAAFRPLSG